MAELSSVASEGIEEERLGVQNIFHLIRSRIILACNTHLQSELASSLAPELTRLHPQLLTSSSPWQREEETGMGKFCWNKPDE